MPDDDRGRTHAACCATCRWWHALGDGWGECERSDDRCADPACTILVPPTLLRVVVRQGPACGAGCCDAALHTEGRFGCRAWEPVPARRDILGQPWRPARLGVRHDATGEGGGR